MNKRKNFFRIAVAVVLSAVLLLLCSCDDEVRSVRSVRINDKGELVVIFTDGTESNMGPVRGADGEKGEPGRDGLNGKDGQDGKDGANGTDGEKGDRGPAGQNGLSVSDATINDKGMLEVTYSDGTTTETSLSGKFYLFGGMCGENAHWGFYNGGVLAIWGEGDTYSYSEQTPAPWSMFTHLTTAVVIDMTDLNESEGLLYGFDENSVVIQRIEQYEVSYIDMTGCAYIYDSPTLETKLDGVSGLPACSEIHIAEKGDGYAKIILDGGRYGYIDIDYVRVGSTDSMVYISPTDFEYIIPKAADMDLRTFPDATGGRMDNVRASVEGEVLCTGVSRNGWWYRVSYNGESLYVWHSEIQIKPVE